MFRYVYMNASARQRHTYGARRAPHLGKVRQRRIAELVDEQGEVTVAELAEQFEVSGMTVRRDLRKLEQQGLVERTHGGAVPPSAAAAPEPPLKERFDHEIHAKRRIGRAVADFIADGETVFIGSGTTTLEIAKALPPERRLTVVTNAVTIVNALAPMPAIDLVVAGGILRREEMSLIGHLTEEALRDIRVDKVVMGMRGVHPEHGLTSDHLPELQTDRAILRTGGEVIIAADHTKLGHIAASRMAPVTVASRLVTDQDAPEGIVIALRQAEIEVILV